MFISKINVYPIKSLGAVSIGNAVVADKGLQLDRRRMLVDERNHFLTQLENAELARFNIALDEQSLIISFENDELRVPFEVDADETANVKIWGSRVKAKIYSPEINRWFSERLQINCRLALMPEDGRRIVAPFYAVRKFKDTVSFADAYPYLLIGEKSLDDLNEKLEKPVPMNRFRPNFVIAGSEPFAEDSWKQIKIGSTIFRVVKPCARCVMTTIDQEKGARDGAEPLKTLAGYRNKNGKVLFGQNLIAENTGETIKIGDRVEVVEFKKSARAS